MPTNTSTSIDWFGIRYPSIKDLEDAAWEMGCVVVYGPVENAFFIPPSPGLPFGTIGVPDHLTGLGKAWALAHELGHSMLHSGKLGPMQRSKQESQADKWASCALIPESRINAYKNASIDAFIGALSAHYEDIPMIDCAARRLAAKISEIRISTLERGVA